MKKTLILVMIFLFSSCVQNYPPNIEVSTLPSPRPVLTEFEKSEKAEYLEKAKKEFRQYIEKVSKDFGVPSLEKIEMTNGDLEVRIWRFSSFSTQDSGLILKRLDNKWLGNLIRRTIKISDLGKKKTPAKFFRKVVNNPKSGWEILWRQLVNEQILTLPDGDEVGNEVCPDCETFVIETKVEGKYRVYDYHSPDYYKEIKETQQIVKIYNLISDELSLSDFTVEVSE
jgi:hypothetical protein